jgi:DNA gyrase subunit B
MYIGGTGPAGRMHLVLELVGNAVDLALLGRARTIDVSLHDDGSVEVSDDGPGLDISNSVVRQWFADGHQRPTADGHYPHIHLNGWGVGAAVVNFLSARFRVVTSIDGTALSCEWTDGGSRFGGVTEVADRGPGTAIRFWPDLSTFDGTDLPVGRLRQRLRELACLIPAARFSLNGEQWSFDQWDAGLAALGSATAPHAAVQSTATVGGLDIAINLVLVDPDETPVDDDLVYANYRRMDDEGPFTEALRQGLNDIDEPLRIGKRIAVVSLTMLDPKVGGPTKSRLDDPRATQAIEDLFRRHSTALGASS